MAVLPDGTRIGAVALNVHDLQRQILFYEQALALKILERGSNWAALGTLRERMVVLYEIPGAKRLMGVTGLYHLAILLSERRQLGQMFRNLARQGVRLQGAADHGVSLALYLSDVEGNDIEICWDRAIVEWPRDTAGQMRMMTEPLDLNWLLREVTGQLVLWDGMPGDARIGHVHLSVNDLIAAEQFYRQVIGFDVMQRYGAGALFLGAGGYHHHVAVNTWAGTELAGRPDEVLGLRWYELIVPELKERQALLGRATAAGIEIQQLPEGWALKDPAGNRLLIGK